MSDKYLVVLEATGVVTEFSTDNGHTWSRKYHNYKAGNFVKPTLFEAVIGPIAPGTPVLLKMMARDTAGNIQTLIPPDAVGLAPARSSLAIAKFRQNYLTLRQDVRLSPNPAQRNLLAVGGSVKHSS